MPILSERRVRPITSKRFAVLFSLATLVCIAPLAAGVSTGALREASDAGLSLAETVEAFLFFRSPVLEAITAHLRRRSVDISDVTGAYREANEAIDGVLVALVSSYRELAQPTR